MTKLAGLVIAAAAFETTGGTMRRTVHQTVLALCTLCVALAPACSDKQAGPTAKNKATKPKPKSARPDVRPRTARELLERVPADAQLAGVVRDLPGLFQLFAELQASFGALGLGAKLLGRARMLSAASPVPLPWTEPDLARLGIDTKRPLLLVGRGDRLLAHLGLKDPAALRKTLATLGPWSEEKHEGTKLSVLATKAAGRVYCRFGPAAAVCGNDRDQVTRWGARAAERSVYAALTKAQRADLEQSSALLWGRDDREGGVVASARAEPDGLGLRARLDLSVLRRMGVLDQLADADPAQSRLLGLATDARGLLYLRLPMRPLLGQLQRSGAGPAAALVDKLGHLSGEVLALEDKQGELALVLGATGVEGAQQVADALAAALRAAVVAQRKRAGKGQGPAVKVTPGKLNGRKAYRLAIKADDELFPMDLKLGLAAGPLGLVLGSWAAVTQLSKIDAADAAPAARALAAAAGESALSKGTYAGLRVGLEDPLRPFGDRLQKMLPAEAPPQLRQGVDLGRFMLDQLYELSMTQAFEAPGAIELRLRLTTKHRRGVAGDDKARALWIQALKAKYSGDPAGHEKGLAALGAAHAGSRFGQARSGSSAGLLSVIVGGAAAVAIPAFVKYVRRSKAVEADLNLSRIKDGARRYYSAEHIDRSGKVQPHGFPRGESGWTPKGPACCKQPGERCISTSKDWSASKQWSALGFAIDGRHRFQYRVVGKGAAARSTITVEARADLDCDGRFSSYQLKGYVRGGAVTFDPVRVTDGLE